MPLRADGLPLRRSGLLACGSPPPSAFPRLLDLSGVCRTEAPRSQLRDSSGFAPDSLGALPPSYPPSLGDRVRERFGRN